MANAIIGAEETMPEDQNGAVYEGVTVLTDAGLRLIGKLLAQQGALKITGAMVGDGQLPDGAVPEACTALVNPLMEAQLDGCSSPGNGEATIAIQVNSPDVEKGFFVREIGVYALDPDLGEILYAYLTYGDRPEWMRPSSSKNPKLITFYLTIVVDRIDRVDLEVSLGAVVYRSELAKIIPDEAFITLEHSLDNHPQVIVTTYRYGAGLGGAGEVPAGGTSPMQVPSKVEYNSQGHLTVYTTRAVARPETAKIVNKVSDTGYIVTFEDNDIDVVYIQLIPTPKARLEDYLSYELATLRHGLGVRPLVMAGALRYGAGMGDAGDGPAGGTDMIQVPVRAVHHGNGSLTIYAPEDVARPGTQKDVLKVGEREFTISYRGNDTDSVYIRLI